MSSPDWLDMSAYPDIEPDEVASQAELARLHATFHQPGDDQLAPDTWDAMLRRVGDAPETAGLPGDGYWSGDAAGTESWDQHLDGDPGDHDAGSHHDVSDPQDFAHHDDGLVHTDDPHHDDGFSPHDDGVHDDSHHDDPG